METLDSVVRFAFISLLAGLWQAPLFAFCAWLLLRLNRTANATTRHSVFAVALFASIVLPIATAALVERDAVVMTTNVPATAKVETSPSKVVKQSRDPAIAPEATSSGLPSIERPRFSVPRFALIAVVGLWLLCALVAALRLLISLAHLEGLKRDALPLDIAYRGKLVRWSAAIKGSRDVRLCDSAEIDIPIAVGLFDAMILIPKHLIDELEPSEIDSIALHELAHLRRSDDWINAIERVAQALLFFNPGIVWLASQLDLEREVACDDWVLQQDDALPYATCLAKVAGGAAWPRRAMVAPGAFITRRGMSIRIERLLAKSRDVGTHTSLRLAGICVAALAVIGLITALVSPSIAYDVTRRAEVVAALPTSSPEPPASVAPAHVVIPKVIVGPKTIVVPHVVVRTGDTTPEPAETPDPADTPDPPTQAASRHDDGDRQVDELIELRALGVDERYARDMRSFFGSAISIDAITGMAAVGVTVPYVNAMSAAGLKNLTPNRVTGMRALGVTPDYISALRDAGYGNLSDDDIGQLQALNVDAAFIKRAQAHGFKHPSVDRLVQLKATGAL